MGYSPRGCKESDVTLEVGWSCGMSNTWSKMINRKTAREKHIYRTLPQLIKGKDFNLRIFRVPGRRNTSGMKRGWRELPLALTLESNLPMPSSGCVTLRVSLSVSELLFFHL